VCPTRLSFENLSYPNIDYLWHEPLSVCSVSLASGYRCQVPHSAVMDGRVILATLIDEQLWRQILRRSLQTAKALPTD
jgi:hypothetical protein